MPGATTMSFTGFRPEAIDFLIELALNNERDWFQPRKTDYERLLKGPLEALCVALSERFEWRDIPLSADPKRSPFRIYRDVRFSRDKSPYKTNIGANFPWTGGGDASAGGYFHLEPGEAFVGGGMWHPETGKLAAFRKAVDERPDDVEHLLHDAVFVKTFGQVGGDRLKRMPTGYPPDHPRAALLKLKDVTFGRRLSDEEVTALDLPELLADAFAVGVPMMRFLAELEA